MVEWQVLPSENYEAFYTVGEWTKLGGVLRVYAAPAKGFALPRIEYWGANGKLEVSFDSWDFQEYSNGIFLPRRCRMQVHDSNGPGFYLDYQFDEIKNINQVIPDSEFAIALPLGTHVSDARSGVESISFDIKKGGPIPRDLEDIIAVPGSRFWGWNWHSAFVLGLVIGLGILVLLLLRRLPLRRKLT